MREKAGQEEMKITESLARKILKARRKKRLKNQNNNESYGFDVRKILFKEQLDFVLDESKFATAVCSVRAGKTTSCAADLIQTALDNPWTTGLYITLARSSAKRIVWPELHKMKVLYNLDAQFNESELKMTFSNGSIIYCSGAATAPEMEKIRGMNNVILVYVDESQAFRSHLKGLVEDILVKRLYDTNGRCRLIGTPGPLLAGYFYEASQSPHWSHHAWTMHANKFLQEKSGMTADQLIAQDMKQQGVDINHPSIQRECFGRWILDTNALLLNYNQEINHYDQLPDGLYTYILGIDLGFDDADALSVLAYSDQSPITWLVEEIITENQLIGTLAEKIKKLNAQYNFRQIIADTGGVGKKVVETLIYQYSLVIDPADKKGKIADYNLLNNALRTGNFRARKDSRFAQDCNILKRDRDRSTPDKIIVEGHSDAVDSVLYAFAFSPAYDYVPPKFKAQPGTPEYILEQESLHKQAIVEKIQRDQALKDGKPIGLFKNKQGRDPWHDWED